MRHVIDMIFEFQYLRSKEQLLGEALEHGERARLHGLAQLLRGKQRDPRMRRDFPRIPYVRPVDFTSAGSFEKGELRDISATGMKISTANPAPIGSRIAIRVQDGQGNEYVFPCEVIWQTDHRMGLKMGGVPSIKPLHGTLSTGVWKKPIRFGAPRTEPMVA